MAAPAARIWPFAFVELVIGNLVEPWLYGVHTRISSLALLVTAVYWTALWGPAGLILYTPLTVCVQGDIANTLERGTNRVHE